MAGTERVGEVLGGKLRVLRLLGTGGMGSVYVAQHEQLGKQVAVKFLNPQHAADADSVRRLFQEARAAAAIGHRGIVDVYDIGNAEDGAPYIVMELVEGESLQAAFERAGVFEVARAVAILVEVLSALGAAHEKGIIHRDLKPDNVFLEPTGEGRVSIRLLDFGVSKMIEQAEKRVTRTGVLLGTLEYMAPEQARGRADLDQRVDVWAAGVMLYELLTGRIPFEGDNYLSILSQIHNDPIPPPRTLRPDLPPELETVLLRALAKDRDERFPTAAAFGEALQPFAAPSTGSAPRASAPVARPPSVTRRDLVAPLRSQRVQLVAGVALAVTAVGLAAWAVSRPDAGAMAARPRRQPARTTAASDAPEERRSVVTLELVGAPEGARVFYDGAEVAGTSIRVAPGDVMVSLRVEAPGLQPFARMVTPDRDQRIDVVLRPPPRAHRTRGQRRDQARDEATRTGTKILTSTEEFGNAP